MFIKKSIFVLCFLGLAVSSYAQGGEGRALFNIVHNVYTGRAILQFNRSTEVLPKSTFVAPTVIQGTQIKHTIEQAILPGYFSNFSSQLIQTIDISQANWSRTFIAHFDQTKPFEGKFVPNFEQALELLENPVLNATPLQEAFENALIQATEGNGKGFFVLAEVGNNPLKPKDVFVLDLDTQSWISLNKSKGKVISSNHNLLRPDIQQATPFQQDILDARGVLIEVDDPQQPTELKVSKDGINWDRYSMDSPVAKKLWAGWNEKGIYISYNNKMNTVLYAQDVHSPGFSSLDALRAVAKSLPGK